MAFDAHKNLAIASVVTAPSPAASGTTLVVGAGQGARFGAVPFNATVWPIDMAPDPTTAEVVRVTARTTDTLTIVRTQEGTTARTILAGDLIAATITAKSLDDIESGVNFPLITTAGNITTGSLVADQNGLKKTTGAGADNELLYLSAAGGHQASARSAWVTLSGNQSGATGNVQIATGTPGKVTFYTGATLERGVMHPSGGFSWGSTTDPGAGNLSAANLFLTNPASAIVCANTTDAADTKSVSLGGGGAVESSRGACVNLRGNEVAGNGGSLDLILGDVPTSAMNFYTGPGYSLRGKIHPSGGFSWGGTGDPGAGVFQVAPGTNNAVSGQTFTRIVGGDLWIGNAGSADTQALRLFNANGQVGSITTNGTATAFNTGSDARLKRDRGPHTDLDVLRRSVVHDFTWRADGTPGRGVFAQEAVEILPAAVSVGGDDRDAGGNLTHPWGVDYSKYVPDLITGWQAHEAAMVDLKSEVFALRCRLTGAEATPAPRMTLWQRIRTFINGLWPAWVTP